MSFETTLLEMLGDAADAWDIRAATPRCYFYDFDGYPLRLWDGQGILTTTTNVGGVLTTEDGLTLAANEWMGTVTAGGTNIHERASVPDMRDGTSPRLSFGFRFYDAEIFAAIKADQDLAVGRMMTAYHAIVPVGEGLAPQTAIRFDYRLTMQGVEFTQSMDEPSPGQIRRTYDARIVCRTINFARSKRTSGTYTDTNQRERAALLGVAADSGCIYVADNASRTYVWD